MKIGTHLEGGRWGSNGGLKDEIKNKTVRFVGRHVKNCYGHYDLAGFLCFPEQLSQKDHPKATRPL